MAENQDSHFRGGQATPTAHPESATQGQPVPMHHRLKLGHLDVGHTNPYGAQAPSMANKVANNQGKTY